MGPRTVGMIGIGLLGSALAERFVGAGFAVIGWDQDPRRRAGLTELGGRPAASPQEAADCERLVLCLPTTEAVECVVAEIGPALHPGLFMVDTTTGDPDRTAALGARLADRGVHYLDATVLGSSEQARAGDVIVMAGGDRTIFEACIDLFACFAREWFHVGPCGAGARMKLVVNLVLGLNRAVLAEGLAFARSCGVDVETALRVLQAGAAYSRVMDTKGRKMIERDFQPQARLAQHLKDVNLLLAQGKRVEANLPLSTLHGELLERVVAAGFGDVDNSAVITAFESFTQPAPKGFSEAFREG